jgi:transketolase
VVTLDSPTVKQAAFGPRRATWVEMGKAPLDPETLVPFESFDAVYRALCSLLFNYVPTSGHPGGSISSGRLVASLLFGGMDYDLSDPARDDADVISYAAGHKALGLYAMWALRNEVARIAAPELLPRDERRQLRLEDLLGFRRNPVQRTPLVERFRAKALDGHPTPATPFVRLATGASGVGLAASLGLAWAAADVYGDDAPRVHVIEGEGRDDAGARRRGARRRGHRLARQRRPSRRLEPGLDRLQPRLPRRRSRGRIRSVDADGAALPQ